MSPYLETHPQNTSLIIGEACFDPPPPAAAHPNKTRPPLPSFPAHPCGQMFQVALNTAAHELGIVWDKKSDMRYIKSVELGRGVIPMLGGNGDFTVTLLPHIAYTRVCKSMPISNRTVVAHCNSKKKAGAKASWMKTAKLWNVKMEHNK